MRLHAFAALGLLACHPALTPRSWSVLNGESKTAVEDGKSVVHLAPKGGNRKGSNVAMALVEGSEFATGTIELDLRGGGTAQASFLGVAFNLAGETSYEAVYFRPFNFTSDDPPHRAHAVQYIAWPEHTWEALRTQTPGVYESAIDPVPDPAGWFHARIEVAPTSVRVFVNDAPQPCLTVPRLATPAKANVALWVDSQPGTFANLNIQPTK